MAFVFAPQDEYVGHSYNHMPWHGMLLTFNPGHTVCFCVGSGTSGTMEAGPALAIAQLRFAKLANSPKLKFWMSQLELEYHDPWAVKPVWRCIGCPVTGDHACLDTWKMPHESPLRITMDEARRGNGVSRHGNQTGEGREREREREGRQWDWNRKDIEGKRCPTSCVWPISILGC